MASISKHTNGWRAQISRKGKRLSKVLPSKRAATDWAARQEYLIEQDTGESSPALFGEILDRYAREVSVRKRGVRSELNRIDNLRKDPIAQIRLSDLKAKDFSEFRERHLLRLTGSTVRRDMGLLTACLNYARREWSLLSKDPSEGVSKPPEGAPRNRRPTQDEIDRLEHTAGYDLQFNQARTFWAFMFAIETGMRCGEIASLTWDDVDLEKQTAHLPITKNGTARTVPLSKEAVRILRALPKNDPVWGIRSAFISAEWIKLREKAVVPGLRFHDSRHEAVTRLSKKLDALPLAKMIGHRDLRMLLNVYYEAEPQDIAKLLD